MTRQHFEAMAKALRDSRPEAPAYEGAEAGDVTRYAECDAQWRKTALRVLEACAGFNANFDRSRFLDAIGWEAPILTDGINKSNRAATS